MSFIEHEWALAQRKADKRIFIEILELGLKTVR
jgi:hypothetical protein